MVVVVGNSSTVVDNDCAFEFRLAGFFTVFDDPIFAVAECCGRKVAGTLNKTRLEGEVVTNVRIRFVVERILRVYNFVGVVVPSVVSDVLGRLTELLERLIEEFVIVLGNVELYLDVSDNLHTS